MEVFFSMFLIHRTDYVLGKLPEQLVIAAVSDLFVCLGSLGYEKKNARKQRRNSSDLDAYIEKRSQLQWQFEITC